MDGPHRPFQENSTTVELDEQIVHNRQLVVRALLVPGIGVGLLVVLFVVAAFFLGWFLVPLALILAGVAAFLVWRLVQSAEERALVACGAVEVDATTHARLHNIADGLSASTGIAAPRLFVVDDPAANLFCVGLDARRSSMVVTSGLVDQLDPIELEGLLAQQLVHVQNLDILPATVAVAYPPLRARLDAERELRADRSAIRITRYPPGLIAALEKVRATRPLTTSPTANAVTHLWTVPPGAGGGDAAADLLDLRIDVLNET